MLIREIFPTIQGEGPNAGLPAVFVRVGGCPLQCVWCDTDFSSAKSQVMHVEEILARVIEAATPGTSLVVITGGEPLAQDLRPLCAALDRDKFRIQVETSGVRDQNLYPFVEVVVSPKTPKVLYQGHVNAWKYIIRAGELARDGLPYYRTQAGKGQPGDLLARPRKWDPVYVQPCDEHDQDRNAANLAAALEQVYLHGYRLSLQQHKILGVP